MIEHGAAGQKLLNFLGSKIPQNLNDLEKQEYIGNEVVAKLPKDQQLLLRSFFNEILQEMRRANASDIELGGFACQQLIWMRINGIKKPIKDLGEFTPNEFSILIQNALSDKQRQLLYSLYSFDFSYTIRKGEFDRIRYRACCYFEMGDLAMNLRAISSEIRSLESYNFHGYINKLFSLAHTKAGLVLVTGITGSGKSTTLDAIIDFNNRTTNGHVVVIARPIEYVHQSRHCIIRQREVGMDTKSFKHGTIEALRQDPDIIVIGEMRDPDTIMAGLEAADSGHKVLSTLHTSSAVESIDRILGEVNTAEQERVRFRLADTLSCVVSQKLVPAIEGKRILAKEVMVMTPSIRAAIRNNNLGEIYQMISEGNRFGMLTMEQDLKRLCMERKITTDTGLNHANNKRRFQQFMQLK